MKCIVAPSRNTSGRLLLPQTADIGPGPEITSLDRLLTLINTVAHRQLMNIYKYNVVRMSTQTASPYESSARGQIW
jgi:hypothetical protein